ncbi:MAG TPA: nucleotide sugar dehydrogenase [Gemmatimonadota bacterium]|nr:nucleotide sugar dehydrogenase [Gemmatimonadota bacterium]
MNDSRTAATEADSAAGLGEKIETKSAVIGVIGLGYVGLPLSLTFAERGYRVLGFDIDEAKVEKLERGESYIGHLDGDRVVAALDAEKLTATADFSRLSEPDALLICVPTPLTANREPDMRFIEQTVRAVASRLRAGQLVVLESTTYPGTTEELLMPVLESTGLVCGRDFFLAFSPEREDPGNPHHTTTTIPKVVGGVDDVSGDLAETLYRNVVTRTVRVSSARAAEATKLMENIFRSVNIALVNELKVIYERMGIDIWEVLEAASTKPFGYMRFDPGPGWGGHCIALDPYYLAWKAREYGKSTRFIELAGEINTTMPEYVVARVIDALNAKGKAVRGSRVLVVGLAYKPNVSDDRESPSYHLMDRLRERGAEVAYHDPHVPVIRPSREHAHWAGMVSVPWDRETIAGFDTVVISTRHDAVDYRQLGEWARSIVDTRNAMAGIELPAGKLWKA